MRKETAVGLNINLREKFSYKTEDSGRFIVTSFRTGKSYYVEAIGDPHCKWGSIDPASGKMMVKKGWQRFKGSIEKDESLINKENGFEKIHNLKPGESPLEYIDRLDSKYEDK